MRLYWQVVKIVMADRICPNVKMHFISFDLFDQFAHSCVMNNFVPVV